MFNFKSWFRRTENYSDQPQQSVEEQLKQSASFGRSAAGVKVDEKTALTLTPVYAAIRVISETLATLPLPVYQGLETGGKQRDRNHPNYDILNVSPDGIISAVQWREAKVGHVLTYGNSYSEIEFSNGGDALAVHLQNPSKVKPERTKSGKIQYNVQGSYVPVPSERMLHFAGLGFDGVTGYSPVRLAARNIGLGLATEAFGAAFFNNGSRGSGVITHPGKLSQTAKTNIRNDIEDVHGGPDNFGKWMIFEEGMSVTPTTIPPEEAQFLQTRGFQVGEIARLYRVPPHMIGDLSNATFSNIEQQSIDFVVNCIRPWCVKIEAEINRKLFAKSDRDQGYFAEFLVDGLLRGDTAARYSAYAIGRQWGWLCVDDIRELENMNPLPKGMGKIYLSPLNMADTADLMAKEPETPAPETAPAPVDEAPEDPSTQVPAPEAVEASLDCVRDNIERMIRRESEAIRHAATKPNEFLRLIDQFYSGHRTICQRAIAPSIKAFSVVSRQDVSAHDVTNQLIGGYSELLDLSGTVSADQLPTAIEGWLTKQDGRSREIAASLCI